MLYDADLIRDCIVGVTTDTEVIQEQGSNKRTE